MLATQSFFKNNYIPNFLKPGDTEYAVDGNTIMLLHGNGDGNDASGRGHHATAVGSASFTSSGVVKLGTGALDANTGNAQGDHFTVNTSADFSFGTGAWTIEFWYYLRDTEAMTNLLLIGVHNGQGSIKIRATAGGAYNIEQLPTVSGSQQSISATPTGNIPQDAWVHFALVRVNNGVETLYHNGTSIGTVTPAATGCGGVHPITMGSRGISSQNLDGLLDEVRISDVARWTSNFTVY